MVSLCSQPGKELSTALRVLLCSCRMERPDLTALIRSVVAIFFETGRAPADTGSGLHREAPLDLFRPSLSAPKKARPRMAHTPRPCGTGCSTEPKPPATTTIETEVKQAAAPTRSLPGGDLAHSTAGASHGAVSSNTTLDLISAPCDRG